MSTQRIDKPLAVIATENDDVITLKELILEKKITTRTLFNNEFLMKIAVENNSIKVVKFLLEDPLFKFMMRRGEFLEGVLTKFDMMELILKAGIKPLNVTEVGQTLINRAIQMTELEIVNLLLQYGPDLNYTDYDGNTSLMIALKSIKSAREEKNTYISFSDYYTKIINKTIIIIEILINSGACIDKKNNLGLTPLDLCLPNTEERKLILERKKYLKSYAFICLEKVGLCRDVASIIIKSL
jgi:ankyrin repeat protein